MTTLSKLWNKNTDKVVEVLPEETMGLGRSIWQAAQSHLEYWEALHSCCSE